MTRPAGPLPRTAATRELRRTLRLVAFSVAFGLASGAFSVTTGVQDHSLGVFAIGLGVLADVTGSAALTWRFRAEIRDPALARRRERQSAIVVGAALAVTAVGLTVESAVALAQQTHPAFSAVTVAAACVSLLVLTPLAIAKRRLGITIASNALRGDGALSAIGAATSALAIVALVMYQLLNWWWADRMTALIVAAVAATEAWRTVRSAATSL
jgi:divalent metal cation (Fe/Co/Zn/Cd) transporter